MIRSDILAGVPRFCAWVLRNPIGKADAFWETGCDQVQAIEGSQLTLGKCPYCGFIICGKNSYELDMMRSKNAKKNV